MKTSHLKHMEILTESGKQYISVFPIRIHDQMNNSIVDKHPSV